MSIFGMGHEVVTSTTKPSSPVVGQLIYCTDTDEYLKYATDVDGVSRWMQAELKPNRNLLINGDMRIWQRGDSINTGGGGASTYAMDRWCFGNNNTSSYNMSKVTNVPSSNFLYSGRLTANTATVYGLNGWEQYIEQANMFRSRGKYLTLSFWVRGSKIYSGATYYVDCGTTADQNPGNGNAFTGSTSLINSSVNITTSWQKVVAVSSIVVPATANVMRVGLPKGVTFVQNDFIEITGVQLEVGTAPSEFEFREFGDELRRCQRYYQAGNLQYVPIGPISYYSSGEFVVPYITPMRTTATVSYSGNAWAAGAGGATAKSGGPAQLGDTLNWRTEMSGGSWTAWYNGSWTASAEL